jgi:putative transposase
MTPEQFEAYEKRLSLTDPGKSYLRRARNGTADRPAAPSRKSRSRVGNLVVRYASGKNEKVLTCESRRVELAIALILENDDGVLEFLTQPPPIELCYVSANNRKVRCMSTPDFLVLRPDRIELVEGKLAEQMQILVKERPGRYQQTGENLWRCPPAEESARALGFDFRVWTDAEFSREYIRNLKHLDPFLKLGPNHFAESAWGPVQDFLLKRPGISLDDLATASGANGPALVRWMLAHRLIYCNLDKHVLADPGAARVYPDASVAQAMEALRIAEPQWPSMLDPAAPTMQPAVLKDLTKALLKHGTEPFSQAYRRWQIITGVIPRQEWDVTPHTVRLWKRDYKTGGYLALLGRRDKQGNTTPRIDPAVVELANSTIKEHYLAAPKKKVICVYRIFTSACAERGHTVPSHMWFYKQVGLVDKGDVIEAQEGSRAAYPYKFNIKSIEGLWDSRGDYPFMDVHCDHTELSVFLRSSRTGQVLGKPWLTVLLDATCRAVLAIYLSFDPPSRDSVMMVLRDCVLRHGRMPLGMVIDNGSEFRSTYFETLTGSNGILVTRRPPHEPKYGNPVENFFKVSETQFIQALEGSSLILKTPRISTKSVDPRNLAIWTLSDLFEALETYCFEIFNNRVNADLGKRPADAFKELMHRHGIDQLEGVKFDNDFLIQTMPEVEGGARVQKNCGVKVRGDYYHNPQLTSFIGKDVPVRWDPMDPSRVLVQLPGGWVQCVSKFAKDVAGLSARDVKFFAQEIRQRHLATARANVPSNAALGKFLRDIKETKEPALRNRVERALENEKVRANLIGTKSAGPQRTPAQPEPVPAPDPTVDDGKTTEDILTREKAADVL